MSQMTDQKYMRPGLDFAVGKATEEAKRVSWSRWARRCGGVGQVSIQSCPKAIRNRTRFGAFAVEMKDLPRRARDNLERELENEL